MKIGVKDAEDIYWVPSLSSASPRDTKMTESLFPRNAQSNEEPDHINKLLTQGSKSINNNMHQLQR